MLAKAPSPKQERCHTIAQHSQAAGLVAAARTWTRFGDLPLRLDGFAFFEPPAEGRSASKLCSFAFFDLFLRCLRGLLLLGADSSGRDGTLLALA